MKIALIGYGKMGKMIEQIAISRGHEIVSIIDIDNQQDFDSAAFASADVAIEFTAPQAAYGNYLKAWKVGVKVVSGSTGWMTEQFIDSPYTDRIVSVKCKIGSIGCNVGTAKITGCIAKPAFRIAKKTVEALNHTYRQGKTQFISKRTICMIGTE